MPSLQRAFVTFGSAVLLTGFAPSPATPSVEAGDFVQARETIDSRSPMPWFQGSSTFTYHGLLGNVHGKLAAVKVNKIQRRWNGAGAGPRPDVNCMPYTDENGVTFSSKYGSFCVGDAVLLPTKVLEKDE